MYCTYLTIYSGNKLPPFYIGYSSIDKVSKGYRGSVLSKRYKDIWQSELKYNPQLFKTIILTKHNTKEDASFKETYFQKHFQVHKNPMYINMHISSEKFYGGPKSEEHRRKLSLANKGKSMSDEARKKLKDSKNTPEARLHMKMINLGKKLTEEHKTNISEGGKKWKRPPMSETQKEKLRKANTGKKASEETRDKLSKIRKGVSKSDSFIEKVSMKVSDGVREFRSISDAARFHKISKGAANNRIKKNLFGWYRVQDK